MNSELTKNISNLIPKSLDDIVRRNRELVELRLATRAEIQTLEKSIENLHHEKDLIEDWRLICLSEKKSNRVQLTLLGNSAENKSAWITSSIASIDFKQNIVLTNSGSIYKLGESGQGEPTTEHLMCVCAALHLWGMGTFLGAPEFFY